MMYPIITASQWFDEVFLSDISAVNVAHLRKWIHGEPEATEAMKYLMNKFASKDGNGWVKYCYIRSPETQKMS